MVLVVVVAAMTKVNNSMEWNGADMLFVIGVWLEDSGNSLSGFCQCLPPKQLMKIPEGPAVATMTKARVVIKLGDVRP